jgi:hypothetical protein
MDAVHALPRRLSGADGPLGDADEFADLILTGRRDPEVRMVDHHEVTVWDVMRALHTHRQVSGFLLQAAPDQGADLLALQNVLLPHHA